MARGTSKATNKTVMDAGSVFKAIDKVLRKPGTGCGNALDDMEQSSWLLFLRYLEAHEVERQAEAALEGRAYTPVLPPELSWSQWAYPVDAKGVYDFNRAQTGDELVAFVRNTLFPGLQALQNTAEPHSIQSRVGAIFSELTCKFTSGTPLREVIDLIQPLKFETEANRHELTALYENRLQAMGNAGRDGGQYYTPRSLIRVMIRVVAPKLGEKIYEEAVA